MDTVKLYEKYRPHSLEEFLGNDAAKRAVRVVLDRGWGGKCWWISGLSGTGKTTLARIIARVGADDFFITEYDRADDLTAEVMREIEQTMYLYGGARGGRVYIVNEAHGLWAGNVRKLLGLLERLPNHVVFIFTTTQQGQKKLFQDQIDAGPLLSRCIPIELSEAGLQDLFARRAQEIARAEGLDGQPLSAYQALAKDCKSNMRMMLQAIEAGQMRC